jgi:hypothetical protein
MSQAGKKIRHLLERSRKAQHKRDCASAYEAMIQAVKEYGFALGAEWLGVEDEDLQQEIRARIDAVFDGCVGG